MVLLLVLHDLGPEPPEEAENRLFSAVFEVAPDHWRVTPGATLVGTEVSPRYLVDHLRRAAERAGIAPRLLLATPVPEEEGAVAAHGLTPEGEAWLREMRG
jgi:hypothetical protein